MRISIITPTFNRYEALSKNIESIKNQGRVDIEHIIIDNLSNDGTKDLVENYINTADHRVVYIRERDSGIYNAMNKGIRKAEGEWLHFLNSDDLYFDSEVLGKVLRYLENHNEEYMDIVCGSVLKGAKPGQGIELNAVYHEKYRYHEFPHQGTFIKRQFFETHGLYDERYKIAADFIYNGRHYHKGKFLILPFPVAFMRNGGISHSGNFWVQLEILWAHLYFHQHGFKRKWGSIKRFMLLLVLNIWGRIKKI